MEDPGREPRPTHQLSAAGSRTRRSFNSRPAVPPQTRCLGARRLQRCELTRRSQPACPLPCRRAGHPASRFSRTRRAAGGRRRPPRPRGRTQAGRSSASARAGGACCVRVRNRPESQAAPARFTSRTRLSPSAAVRFGVNPRSPIRATIVPSTITSSTSALTTATSWMRSIQFGRADGSRADMP